ncbi:MAG: 3-phosphoshikimate 1-carboxyvinyltransferase [Actinomycetota bacterium]|nr:3-phosphoshikimate 1-carboxyvinyltransferase [Actinomycetota bacterium]
MTVPELLPLEVSIEGPRPLVGRLRVPGDKSISHRVLLLAAVATGTSRLSGVADGDDVARTRAAVEALGARVRGSGDGLTVRGGGFEGLSEPEGVLDCANSGTSIRLLAGLLAGRPFHSVLDGDASLRRRPMARVVEPLRTMGAWIDGRAGGTLAPLSIRGGPLAGRRHELAVASAQVKTALILAGVQAQGPTEVIEPATSRDHTERLLATLGVDVVPVPGGVRLLPGPVAPFELAVPGDPSAAAFFVVGACVTPGSDLVVTDVCLNPTRIGFIEVLRRMGAKIDTEVTGERGGEPVGNLHVIASPLAATAIRGREIPSVIDEIPALAVAAAFAEGTTEIADAAELRVKESDRVGTVSQELSQLGITVDARPDGMLITGGRPRPGLLKSHGDHRVAMAAAIAANACEGTSTVRGWRAIASSYPTFALHLEQATGGGDTAGGGT